MILIGSFAGIRRLGRPDGLPFVEAIEDRLERWDAATDNHKR